MRTLPVLLLTACQLDASSVVLVASPEHAEALAAWEATLQSPAVSATSADDPVGARPGATRLALVIDTSLPAEAFRIAPDAAGAVIHGGDRLGLLYGAGAALEQLGWRFPHPHLTVAPRTPLLPLTAEEGQPEMARRGLHLHTLHPVDTMFDAWVPTEAGLDRMEAVIDWVVRHRGNYLQWVALDDIQADPATAAAWRAHTAKINEAADLRGVSTGLGIQLFGQSNLQQAFDLVDAGRTPAERAEELGPRLDLVTGLGFDVLSLSFGEFFGAEPADFVAAVTETYDAIQARQPGTEVPVTLHVGDDLRVTWEGRDLLYYFLALEVDRPLTPWVHTVMFYGLYGDAGGAYGHDDFNEHRDLLLQRLRDGEPVGYHPESGYWIAFDSPVPQFLPVYIQARWDDLHQTREATETAGVPGLQDHVIFTSGWEWGYGLTDAATLRMSYTLPESACAPVTHLLDTPNTADLSAHVCAVMALQQAALIDGRLAPWLASQDAIMELGFGLDIIAQPFRPSFATILAARDAELAPHRATRDALAAHELALQAELLPIARLPGVSTLAPTRPRDDDPVRRELLDALQLQLLRTSWSRLLVDVAVTAAEGGDVTSLLSALDARLEAANRVVQQRHAALHDPGGRRLLDPAPNPTIYDFGYLHRADTLCFWDRERAQLRRALGLDSVEPPGCAL